MKVLIFAFAAAALGSALAGNTYYIDPVNGNDTWDGSCAFADRQALDEGLRGLKGPRRTLVGADGLTTASQGDVVYLAEGTYAECVYTNSYYGSFRGNVKVGVTLIASGSREKTIVMGAVDSLQTDAGQYGCGPNAVSCLFFAGTDSAVRGVTLTGGRSLNAKTEGEQGRTTNGGACRGSGWVVDCLVTNNVGHRGGALSGAKAVGCRFAGNRAVNTGADMYGGSGYNCFFGNVLSSYNVYMGGPFVNCTFFGSGWFGRSAGVGYFNNCIIAKADGGNNKNAFTNCLFVDVALSSDSTADDSNAFTTAAAAALETDGVTGYGSVAVDCGDRALYDAKYPTAAVAAGLKEKDGLGGDRQIGATIDIGATEVDWRKLPSTSGLDLVINGRTISVSRNFTSPTCCLGFTFDDDEVIFPDDDDAYVWEKTVEDDLINHTLAPIYSNDWYVDAVNGNDANDGFTAKRAKKTLAGAMAIPGLKSGHVVHAAPGVYNEGVMAPQDSSCYCSNRVVIAAGVGLVADQGPDVTAIEGYKSQLPGTTGGIGSDAIRCVYGKSNTSYVRGFTLRNGSTPVKKVDHDSTASGGAVMGATALDCVITNNTCSYRGGAGNGVRFIRCRISDNTARDGTGGCGYGCRFYGCVLSGQYVLGGYYNCWLDNAPWGSSAVTLWNSYVATSSSLSSTTTYDLRFSVLRGGQGSATLTAESTNNVFNATAAAVAYDTAANRPRAESILRNAGSDELFLSSFPAEFAFLREQDFSGGVRRVGTIDVGPGEYDWSVSPQPEGLFWSVTTNNDTTVTLTVTRDLTCARLCTGFTYGDETVAFDDLGGAAWTKTMPAEALLQSDLKPVYVARIVDWYVDPVNGSDANRGYHVTCPRRTLAGIMADRVSGDVVHAAPGDYNEGEMWGNSCSNRVVIAAGVGLVAEQDGATIWGKAATGPTATAKGHGDDALRCVHLVGSGSWMRGFKITGGHTRVGETAYDAYACGGGVNGNSGSAVIDCEIVGNSADKRGPAVSGGTYVRCTFHGNGVNCGGSGDYHVYMVEWLVDCAVYGADLVYSNGRILNSTLCGGATWGTAPYPVYNSYLASDSGNKVYTNCFFGSSSVQATSTTDETCRFGVPANFDANQRPKAGSPCIDAADRVLYETVAATVTPEIAREALLELDVSGGQRVYNAALDVGAGEYDWRGAYSTALKRRAVTVTEASPDVVLADVGTEVSLPSGGKVVLTWAPKTAGAFSFAASAELTVTGVDGVTYADGRYSFETAETPFALTIENTGETAVSISDFKGGDLGLMLLFR